MKNDPERDGNRPVTSTSEIPTGDWATWTCHCGAFIQGGRRGLVLHQRVVHGER